VQGSPTVKLNPDFLQSVPVSILPSADNSYDLGSGSLRWKYVHVRYGLRAYTQGYSPRSTEDDTYKVLHAAGSTSDFIITLQDGTGRVQFYWNATPYGSDSASKFIVGGEDAGKILFHPPGDPFFAIYWADGSTASAGDTISWGIKFAVYQGGDIYFPGKVRNDVLPSSDNSYDIGNSSYRWANVYAVNVYASELVQAGDLAFKNGWRFTEDERYGIVLISPEGKKYRLVLEEVN